MDELLLSRVDVVLLHGRGCLDPDVGTRGVGNMCPRLLTKFVAAVERAEAEDAIRVGMWDDTGAYAGTRAIVESLPHDTKFDMADTAAWRFFWDHNIKIWFDVIPQSLWYLMDGKPIIALWDIADVRFENQEGNASALLSYLKREFKKRYGLEPAFVLDRTWVREDSTIGLDQAAGVNDWFYPIYPFVNNYTYRDWAGAEWGVVIPGFRNPDTRRGCGILCREYPRFDGQTLDTALKEGSDAKLVLLEGWTDIAESAGFYRSPQWQYPAQYINIVRRHADPEPETLRFEAEGADRFHDKTTGNIGGHYRSGDLDIQRLRGGSGWAVGWTSPGEWLEYQDVELGCGTYRFTARAATPHDGQSIRLDLEGLSSVETANTGSWHDYELVHLGEAQLDAGTYDLRVVFETGGVNLDWYFVRRSADSDTDGDGVGDCFDKCPNDANKTAPAVCGCGVLEGACPESTNRVALKTLSNNRYVCAYQGRHGGRFINNCATDGPREEFTLVGNADGTVSMMALSNNRYVAVEIGEDRRLTANRTTIGPWEKFELVRNSDSTVSLLAMDNNRFVAADASGRRALVADRSDIGPWEKFVLETVYGREANRRRSRRQRAFR